MSGLLQVQAGSGADMGTMRLVALGAAVTAAVSLLAPQPAEAQAARWSVDGSGARCTLTRPLEGREPATLVIRTVPTTDKYELMLIGEDRWKRSSTPFENVRITFQPSGAVHEKPIVAIVLGAEIGSRLGATFLPRGFLEDFGRSEAMTITIRKRDLGPIAYTGADKAVEALNLCVVAKLIEWGADPAGFEAGAQRPRALGEPTDWLLGSKPSKRLGLGMGVRAGVARLHLDTAGRVEACELLEGTKDSLTSSACSRLKAAASYEPARDKEGNPVRSVMLVSWDIRSFSVTKVG